ncbi:hypothetical protein Y032_0083g1679 [Ancylostoma ceylanicum]|uniref:Uncharacterized protein n=1 Tax=Ancylostoma ceylanicum TaxID=53326 RepID=A0A016TS89_9BILA|nr:hypothetical protein Y032_0083g1679 [Ancylostoma ceylanicum]
MHLEKFVWQHIWRNFLFDNIFDEVCLPGELATSSAKLPNQPRQMYRQQTSELQCQLTIVLSLTWSLLWSAEGSEIVGERGENSENQINTRRGMMLARWVV